MPITIKFNNGRVPLIVEDCDNIKAAIVKTVTRGADLQGAYLRGADLQGADLQAADLQGADLQGADLQGADLRGADLQGAYLQGADLRGAYLQGAEIDGSKQSIAPYQIYGFCWDVTITRNSMQIGCQLHPHEEWEAFTREQIEDLDEDGAATWFENKPWVMALCAQHRQQSAEADPKEETKVEEVAEAAK